MARAMAPVLVLPLPNLTPRPAPSRSASTQSSMALTQAERVLAAAETLASSDRPGAADLATLEEEIDRMVEHPTGLGLWNAGAALSIAAQMFIDAPGLGGVEAALLRLRECALFPLGRPLVNALLRHADQGGSPEVRDLLLLAANHRRLCQRVESTRCHGGTVDALEPELVRLVDQIEDWVQAQPAEVLSSVDLAGIQAALELMDVGTDALYRSADAEAARQREALTPRLPAGAELVDESYLADEDGTKLTEVAARLAQLVTDHAMFTDVGGVRMISYPEDKQAPDPGARVLERYLSLSAALRGVEVPRYPDDLLHDVRAAVAVALESETIRYDILLARTRAPRSVEELRRELAGPNLFERGRTSLRHPVEIRRWVGVLIEEWVRHNASLGETREHWESKGLAAVEHWLEGAPGYDLYAATFPMWRAAIADHRARLVPKR
ncbi:MAG: hypothetical protein U1E65_20860 [Myxococcota bacterium]